MKLIKTLKDEYINANMQRFIAQDETVEEVESFFLTPLTQEETNLPMNVYLRCIKNFNGEPPFLRFQNNRSSRFNTNWVKIYLNGRVDNYENKAIPFLEEEMYSLLVWIELNKEAISKHYYQEYSSCDICKNLKNI